MNTWGLLYDRPIPYAAGLERQTLLHRARLEDGIPDTVLWLEHTPVVTLGRRGRDGFLNATPDELRQQGIDLVTASRGGDVTYHGPGQWVMYPILKLGSTEADAHGYLYNLEEVALRTAAAFGVEAWRREGKSGAWTEAGKIAAIGFHIKRWVTLHGMSFNATLDPAAFNVIVPCGLVGEPVASLSSILGPEAPTMNEVRDVMTQAFEEVFQRPIEHFHSAGDWPRAIEPRLKPFSTKKNHINRSDQVLYYQY